jgi:hypothetical protein
VLHWYIPQLLPPHFFNYFLFFLLVTASCCVPSLSQPLLSSYHSEISFCVYELNATGMWVLTASYVCRTDGKYNAQGKLGAAVLGNTASQVYQLLLYKGKQQHVTSARISATFQFVVRQNLWTWSTSKTGPTRTAAHKLYNCEATEWPILEHWAVGYFLSLAPNGCCSSSLDLLVWKYA